MSNAIAYEDVGTYSVGQCDEGRFIIMNPTATSDVVVRFALAIPEGLDPQDVVTLRKGSTKGSKDRIRYGNMLPYPGGEICRFGAVEDAKELLSAALENPVTMPIHDQIRNAGFKAHMVNDDGIGLYRKKVRTLKFCMSVHRERGVSITFRRTWTHDVVIQLHSDHDCVFPGFLATRESQIGLAIAAANLYEAKGRTGRRKNGFNTI